MSQRKVDGSPKKGGTSPKTRERFCNTKKDENSKETENNLKETENVAGDCSVGNDVRNDVSANQTTVGMYRSNQTNHGKRKAQVSRQRSRSAGRSGDKGKLCVIKVGTSSLMTEEAGSCRMKLQALGRLIDTIITLKSMGHRVVLVSSGAIGCGRIKLGLKQRPTTAATKQAVAAAGQSYLMRLYEDLFEISSGQQKQKVAQLLIARRDFNNKQSFENIRNTVHELLDMCVVPIVNENDAVQPCRLDRFGDNDQLASLTAVNLDADWLFLCTDVDYVYTANPNTDPDAKPIKEVKNLSDLDAVTTELGDSKWGTGGMGTKIAAAKIASCAGIQCVLVNGQEPEQILNFMKKFGVDSTRTDSGTDSAMITPEELKGTYFHAIPTVSSLKQQRRWILALPAKGSIYINAGAGGALFQKKSLLAAGMVRVEGNFVENDCVQIYMIEATTSGGSQRRLSVDSDISDVHELTPRAGDIPRVTGSSPRAASPDDSRLDNGGREKEFEKETEKEKSVLIAHGLVNFSSDDMKKIKGLRSSEFAAVLNYSPDPEVCYRENIILIRSEA